MDANFKTPVGDPVQSASETVTETETRHRSAHFPIGSIIFIFVLITIFAGQTFAYFKDSQVSDTNKIISGSIDVSLIEVSNDGNYYWSAEPVKVMPAGVYNYGGFGVQNNGTIPVYIRIKVEKSIIQSEHEISSDWEHLISCNFAIGGESSWVYHEGYYYYKFALVSGEQTSSLFDKVLFAPEMGNEFKNSSIQFKLICQSVQAGGNSPDPLTAWGWPEGNGGSQ